MFMFFIREFAPLFFFIRQFAPLCFFFTRQFTPQCFFFVYDSSHLNVGSKVDLAKHTYIHAGVKLYTQV